MEMSLPMQKNVKIEFAVRLKIRDEDLKRFRAEQMDSRLTHVDTVVSLGANDFETDDERLFAVDFAETLKSENGNSRYEQSDLVPGRLVLDMSYPIKVEDVAIKVIAFLKTGVRESARRDEAQAKLKAQIALMSQMVTPVIDRFNQSKADLVRRCLEWNEKQQAARRALDVKSFEKLKKDRLVLMQEIGKNDLAIKELAELLKTATPDDVPMKWSVSLRLRSTSRLGGNGEIERSSGSTVESSLEAKLAKEWPNKHLEIKFKGVVTSPLFRRWTLKETIDVKLLNPMMDAFSVVEDNDNQEYFDQAAREQQEQLESAQRDAWIDAQGSQELKTAKREKLAFMSLYAREKFILKCNEASADLGGFKIDVDGNMFYSATLSTHNDPSPEALKLIAAVAREFPGIGVGRMQAQDTKVKAINSEVIVVPGKKIAPNCPDLYIWRQAGRGTIKNY